MATSRAQRNKRVDEVLASLTGLRGVTAAAIVDPDGFVTHIRRDFDIDTEALGAAVQIVYSAAMRAAAQVGQDGTRLILSENKSGLVIIAPIARGFTLTMVADGSAMLGAVRFEMKETLGELQQLFSE